MKTIVTITGIRPDFIRMSQIFKKLDENFNHILIHTGQHYDDKLSGVFFKELKIREPNYNLGIGGGGHHIQNAKLSVGIIELLRKENISPDLIIFLGDSNSVCCSMVLKKEGYRIAHIEAGMRSGDKRMLEEINRTVCDHCSDYHFVYHPNYKEKLIKENLPEKNIFVVGNTIVEVCLPLLPIRQKTNSHIIVDIHRPENFLYGERLRNIIKYAKLSGEVFRRPVKFLAFPRTLQYLAKYKIVLDMESVALMSYKEFIEFQYDAKMIISDSGTAQEEPALLRTPVVCPRDFTERPESVESGCSYMIDVDEENHYSWGESLKYVESDAQKMDSAWLGPGLTSSNIIHLLKQLL